MTETMTTEATLDAVPHTALPALRERLGVLRHDLGKYVVFQIGWLPPDPTDDDLREALLADLVRTRSGGGRIEAAPEIWARIEPGLVGREPLGDGSIVDLGDDLDLATIRVAIATIQRLLPQLDLAPRPILEQARQAALDASGATRRLWKRARAL
jgi:hypothetical protein